MAKNEFKNKSIAHLWTHLTTSKNKSLLQALSHSVNIPLSYTDGGPSGHLLLNEGDEIEEIPHETGTWRVRKLPNDKA